MEQGRAHKSLPAGTCAHYQASQQDHISCMEQRGCVPMLTQLASLPHCTISTTAQWRHVIKEIVNICDLSAVVSKYIYSPHCYFCWCLTHAGFDVLGKRGVAGSRSNTIAICRSSEKGNGWLCPTLILFGAECYWKTLRPKWGICKWNMLTLWLLALWEKENTI